MRKLDYEAVIIERLKQIPQLADIPIMAGWPGWEVPPTLTITVSLMDAPADHSIDVNARSKAIKAQIWVNVWATDDKSAWETATLIDGALDGWRYIPSEGAEIVFITDGIKPQHEIALEGTIYRYQIEIAGSTTEKMESG